MPFRCCNFSSLWLNNHATLGKNVFISYCKNNFPEWCDGVFLPLFLVFSPCFAVHLKYEGQISGNQPPRPIQAIRIPERSGAQHATRPNQPFSTKQPTKFSYPPTPLRHPLTILKCVTNSHLPVRSTSTKFVSTSMFSPVKKFTLTSLFDWNQTSMLTYSSFLKTPFCQIVFKLPFFLLP